MTRILTVIVMVALAPGLVSGFWQGVAGIASHRTIWVPVLIGFASSLVLDRFLHRRMVKFAVFEHELTHSLAGFLFLRRVRGFVAGKGGGAVKQSGNFGGKVGDDFIGLAPYFMPTFTVAAVLLRPALPENCFPWYDGFIGLTFGFHLWTTFRETKSNWHAGWFSNALNGEPTQTDIGSRGFLFSGVYIATMTVFVQGLLGFILVRDYAGVPDWVRVFSGALARFWTGLVSQVSG